MKKLVVLACMLMACNAFAIADPDANSVGIYFDMTADTTNDTATNPYGNSTAYLLLTNPTTNGILGWEATITYVVENAVCGNVAYALPDPTHLDGDPAADGFAVGYATPSPVSDVIHLLTITTFYCGDCTSFFLSPATVPGIEGTMAFLDGEDVGRLVPMAPSSGSFDEPVAGIGMSCVPVVATEASSWGSVKSLYR